MDANPSRRKIGIVCACLLGIVALLYLSGLIGQLLSNYSQWLEADGPSGAATMAPLQLGPFQCFRYAFTPQGVKGMFFALAAAGILFAGLKLHNRFGGKQTDARNFALSTHGTYGTAGWMTAKDMRDVLEVTAPGKAEGIILGQDNGSVVCLPNTTRLNKHIMVIGASGTGKSRCFIRPAIFQAVKRKNGAAQGESVIITDPKGELFTDLSEFLRDQGYLVKVFNLVNPEHSDSWNCMANLHGDPFIAQILVDAIISNTSHDKGDHFWDSGESNLLKALMLYVDLDPTLEPTDKNLSSVYQMLIQHTERQLSLLFDRLPLDHPARAPYNLFAQASDTVRAGIVLGLGIRLFKPFNPRPSNG